MVQIKVSGGVPIQMGDFIAKAGIYTKPGVVVDRKEGSLVIDTSPNAIAKYHRHSNTTGMSVEDKERFNTMMDEVMKMEKNDDRLTNLQRQIEELKATPENKRLADSLKNEQAQLIRLSRDLPRVYQFDSKELRY